MHIPEGFSVLLIMLFTFRIIPESSLIGPECYLNMNMFVTIATEESVRDGRP